MVTRNLDRASDSLRETVLDFEALGIIYGAGSVAGGLIAAEVAGNRVDNMFAGSQPAVRVGADVGGRLGTGFLLAMLGQMANDTLQTTLSLAAFGATSSGVVRFTEAVIDFLSETTGSAPASASKQAVTGGSSDSTTRSRSAKTTTNSAPSQTASGPSRSQLINPKNETVSAF